MTAYVPATAPSLDIGRVIGRLFRVLGAGFLPAFLSIYAFNLACSMVNFVVTLGITAASGADYDRMQQLIWISMVTSFTAFALIYAMATVAMTRAALALENGEPIGFARLFGVGIANVIPVALVGAVYSVVFWFAALFLILPSAFVRVFWIVAGPARAGEKIGWLAAFGRSASLTDGSRIMILVLAVLYGIAMIVAFYALFLGSMLIIGGMATLLPRSGAVSDSLQPAQIGISLVILVVYSAVTTLLLMINAAMPAALYVELRSMKEGASGHRLDQVFA